MQCESLKFFQDELRKAVDALTSIACRPVGIRDIDIFTTRLELAHEALSKHRSTCLTCANERRKARLYSLDRQSP